MLRRVLCSGGFEWSYKQVTKCGNMGLQIGFLNFLKQAKVQGRKADFTLLFVNEETRFPYVFVQKVCGA